MTNSSPVGFGHEDARDIENSLAPAPWNLAAPPKILLAETAWGNPSFRATPGFYLFIAVTASTQLGTS